MAIFKIRRAAVAAAILAAAVTAYAVERPPPDDSRIQFKKTLHIQNTPKGEKIFAETKTLSRGDFIEKILREEYGIAKDDIPFFMEAFRTLNPEVDPKNLVVGKTVKIPFKVELSATIPPAPPPPPAPPKEPPKIAPPAAVAAPPGKYTVKKGDTLWSILSKIYGVDKAAVKNALSQIQKVNPKLRNVDTLLVGQVLEIPVEKLPNRPAPPPAATPQTQEPAIVAVPASPAVPQPAREKTPAAVPAPVTLAAPSPVSPGPIAKNTAPPPAVAEEQKTAAPQPPQPAAPLAAEPKETPQAPIPVALSEPPTPPAEPKAAETPIEIFALLEKLGCKIERSGERYIPVSRGRSIKLDAEVFPLISGPAGGRALVDAKGKLSPEIGEAIKNVWGYTAVRPEGKTLEGLLGEILSELKFHEMTEGARSIPLAGKTSLKVRAKWAITPLPEDKWRGGAHLIFPQGAVFDPDLESLAQKNGYTIDSIGEKKQSPAPKTPVAVSARFEGATTVDGAARLVSLLGVTPSIKPAVTLKLDNGISYTIRPPLVFEKGNLKYAIPPAKPANAESIMLKAGYFTFPWPESGDPLARVSDLLVLMGAPIHKKELLLPVEGAISLSVFGIEIDDGALAAKLYPELSGDERAERKIFLTAAALPPEGVSLLYRSGYLPWVIQ